MPASEDQLLREINECLVGPCPWVKPEQRREAARQLRAVLELLERMGAKVTWHAYCCDPEEFDLVDCELCVSVYSTAGREYRSSVNMTFEDPSLWYSGRPWWMVFWRNPACDVNNCWSAGTFNGPGRTLPRKLVRDIRRTWDHTE